MRNIPFIIVTKKHLCSKPTSYLLLYMDYFLSHFLITLFSRCEFTNNLPNVSRFGDGYATFEWGWPVAGWGGGSTEIKFLTSLSLLCRKSSTLSCLRLVNVSGRLCKEFSLSARVCKPVRCPSSCGNDTNLFPYK